jgi:hypothetical protein
MTKRDATFTFYPAVREGYRPDSEFSKQASEVTDAGTTQIEVDLRATGSKGTKRARPGIDLTVYGPGEVTNVDDRQVVRVEPEPSTTEFPPNYFPLVEFDSPQLPWVFSPEQADAAGRNRPWLCLVAVEQSQVTYTPTSTGPLPVLETPAGQLPPASETWAWAHAQIVDDDSTQNPEQTFATRSARTVSRLLCPRNLDEQTSYRACVVPTFEPGRRAGLGLEPYPDGRGTVALAWDDADSVRLPVYYSWEFTTSKEGDFESLVRELDPVQFGEGVGFRTVDVSNPGPAELKLAADEATQQGTVGIGGALKSLGATPDPYDEAMQDRLRALLNTPESVEAVTDYGAVGPPLYGQYHAGVPYLEPESVDTEEYYYPAWCTTLNTDPRHRIAAGYGAAVIRENQERFVKEAWEQFGDLDGLNEHLHRAQLAEEMLGQRHQTLQTYSTGALAGITSPLHGTLENDEGRGRTVRGTAAGTDLPDGLASSSFRRLTRPNGPLARQQGRSLDPESFALRLETGRVPRTSELGFTGEMQTSGSDGQHATAGDDGAVPASAPGQSTPELPGKSDDGSGAGAGGGASAGGDAGDTEHPPDIERLLTAIDGLETHVEAANEAVTNLELAVERDETATVRDLVETRPTVLDTCESIGQNTFGPLSRAVAKLFARPRPEELPQSFDRQTASGHLQDLHAARRSLESAVEAAMAALDAGEPPRAVRQRLDRASGALRDLRRTASRLRRGATATATEVTALDTGPAETGQVAALDAPQTPAAARTDQPAPVELPDTDALRSSILSGLDPERTIPAMTERITGLDLLERDDPVEEVLAAPEFTEPTADLLTDFDQDVFLPGVDQVPRESIGVLQTNPAFIESFMTGLNHEFARELQWRNFPTDRRGTYFRRFWERRGNPNTDPKNPESAADIPPIHTWDETDLGNNLLQGDTARVVLLVRGELLRRYPNTNIFAAKAVTEHGGPDLAVTASKSGDRVPALPGTPITRSDEGPDVKFPEFRGRLEPDITFFCFDLSPREALYDPYHHEVTGEPDDHPNEGWFFVFQEPPAETRFGLDVPGDDEMGPEPPYGVRTDSGPPRTTTESKADEVEEGWSGLTWAHVSDGSPDTLEYVAVNGSRPDREGWRVEAGDSYADNHTLDDRKAAEWGYNSAHMARITWQLPVRVSIHADDMIPEQSVQTAEQGGEQ